MRHRKHNVGLNRTASHRRALLANLAGALFTHKKIITTLPKAKAARSYAERLITFARKGDLAARRQVLRKIRDKVIVDELFRTIGPKFRDRDGGYTRIIHLDNRIGDNAPMAILELVGFAVDDTGKKSTKGRKGKAPKPKTVSKAAAEPAEEAPVEVLEEPVAVDEVKDEEAVETASAEESTGQAHVEETIAEEVPATLPEEEKNDTSAEVPSSDASVTEADEVKKEPEKSATAEDADSLEAGTVSGQKAGEDKGEKDTSKGNQSES